MIHFKKFQLVMWEDTKEAAPSRHGRTATHVNSQRLAAGTGPAGIEAERAPVLRGKLDASSFCLKAISNCQPLPKK